MTYATSTSMNTLRKYNTIKTDAPDYLLAILSHYSSKLDGSCLVCLPSVALPRTSHAHAPRVDFGFPVRFVSPEQLVFLLDRERARARQVSSDGEPLPRPRQRALPRPRCAGARETEVSGDEYGRLPHSTGESHGGGGGRRSLLRRAQLRSAVTQL